MPGQYGTIPARRYKPAGQQGIRLRCPPGSHAHGGFPYCHEEGRQHRVAHAELHQEERRIQQVEHRMNELGNAMHDLVRQKKNIPPAMRRNYARLYTYIQRVKGTQRRLPINRAVRKLTPDQTLYSVRSGETPSTGQAMIGKDGGGAGGAGGADQGGPGVGPDILVGEDVHVHVYRGPGRRQKPVPAVTKAGCGFALYAELLALAKRCPPGQHRHGGPCHPQERKHHRQRCPGGEHKHGDFPCHPQERKHRGGRKPAPEPKQRQPREKAPERPYPSRRAVRQQKQEAWNTYYDLLYSGSTATDEEKGAAKIRYEEFRQLEYEVRDWERSAEGQAWVNAEKVRRAQGQGKKGREHYEAKAAALEEKYQQLRTEHEKVWAEYQEAIRGLRLPADTQDEEMFERREKARTRYKEATVAVNANSNKLKSTRLAIDRAKAYSAVGFAREWVGVIQRVAGGVEPKISAIRTGSKSYAHYSLDSGIIGISDRGLELLSKIRDDPDLLFTGDEREQKSYAYAVSALVHEFLHSVNPAVGAYVKGGITGMIEEGLTDAIANRMVARPDVLSELLGKPVDKGIVAEPGPSYLPYVQTMEYLAERAAQRRNVDPEWFLGKWKFHTDPKPRGNIILEDAFGDEGLYQQKPWRDIMRDAKDKLPQMKQARQAQRAEMHKAVEGAWLKGVPRFIVRATAGYPSNIDVGRHVGSPPKGESFQKFPRQGSAMKAEPGQDCSECATIEA